MTSSRFSRLLCWHAIIAVSMTGISNVSAAQQPNTAVATSTAINRSSQIREIDKPPARRGRYDSADTALEGDWSHGEGEEYRITGPNTLGRPAMGYVFTPEASPHYLALYNSSGWNESTSGNQGRTAAVGYRVQGYQYGQGDLIDFNGTCFVKGRRPRATNFLANPACGLFSGDAFAGEDGVYLNPIEVDLDDQGHAVAGIGAVFNLQRSNAGQGLGVWWAGIRLQQHGAAPVDVAWSASGQFRVGLDFSNVSFGSDAAAITLSAGQRIYGNAQSTDVQQRWPTSMGRDWIERDRKGGWNIVANGFSRLRIDDSAVTAGEALRAVSVSSTVGVASVILGNDRIVGAGASVVCAAGHVCDQFSGTYLITTGSGISTRGPILTLFFAESRKSSPNCVVGLQQGSESPVAQPIGTSETPSRLSFIGASALQIHSTYTATYVCGGS